MPINLNTVYQRLRKAQEDKTGITLTAEDVDDLMESDGEAGETILLIANEDDRAGEATDAVGADG